MSDSSDRRCTATNNKGQRCGKWALKGLAVCMAHGGGTKAARAKGERVAADRKVRELAARMDVDPADFSGDPYAALRTLLARDAAEVERFARLVAQIADGDETYVAKSGVEQLRAALAGYRAERDAQGRRLELLLKADVARAMAERDSARDGIIDDVVQLLETAVATVLMRHSAELGPKNLMSVRNEFVAEFRTVCAVRDRTSGTVAPVH
jgi:hypothetical protein